MNNADDSMASDRWGEPLQVASDETRRGRRRWWWTLGGICAIVMLVAVFYEVRSSRLRSLSTSCRQALRAEDWTQVERLATRWRAWERGRAEPLIFLAEAANRTQRYERAVELLGQLPNDDPLTPPALLECSAIQFGPLNRPIDGAETLQRAIKLDPKLVEARRRLIYFYAYTLQRRKMVDLAYDTIEQDCDLPETYIYLMLQDSLSFSDAYDVNTRWFLGNRDEELFLVSRAIYRVRAKGLDTVEDPREGERDESGVPFHRKVISEYLARFPQNLELLAYFLNLRVTEGDIDEVARLLSKAPPAAEHDNRFWRYEGWLRTARDQIPQAKKAYERALALNPFDHLSRHQLAAVERRLKNFDRVEELEAVAREGKALRRQMLELESVAQVPPSFLQRLAAYAEKCGDDLVACQLRLRISQWAGEWAQMGAKSKGPQVSGSQ